MCSLCGFTICPSRCPNYVPHKAEHYCLRCGDGIYEGDKYIENNNGDYIHYECVDTIRELLEFLGYDIKTMEDF